MKNSYHNDWIFFEAWSKVSANNGTPISRYSIKDGYLFFQKKLCVTRSYRHIALEDCHQPPFVAHRGQAITLDTLTLCLGSFSGLQKKDVAKFVSQCEICQKVKSSKAKPLGLLMPFPIPNYPWEQISMDFIIGFPSTHAHNDMIWTKVD